MQNRIGPIVVHAAIVAASFAASAVIVLAVGGAFHAASREPWLADTPHARHVAARCGAEGGRQARQDCVRAAVAQARARDAGGAQLARAASAAP